MTVSNGVLKWVAIAAIAAAAGVAVSLLLSQTRRIELGSGTLLQTPRPIPDFKLQGASGASLGNADFKGHWTLVFAGFTFCPDVCPTTLTELKAVRAKLSPETRERLTMLFLSIDPGRDTPEKIAKYLAFFDPGFVGATGDEAQLQALGAALGYVYAKVPGSAPSTYTMDHSTALILIDPEARVAGYLTPPFKPERMAADLDALIAQTRAAP